MFDFLWAANILVSYKSIKGDAPSLSDIFTLKEARREWAPGELTEGGLRRKTRDRKWRVRERWEGEGWGQGNRRPHLLAWWHYPARSKTQLFFGSFISHECHHYLPPPERKTTRQGMTLFFVFYYTSLSYDTIKRDGKIFITLNACNFIMCLMKWTICLYFIVIYRWGMFS